ncbi:MAG TPA: hypothetical protein VMQ56_17600 [Terracidiphilus sp.]|jgi:hypothetical protein|nr:hypothetical protein [Terracidiphilus sp.]
MLSLIKFMFGCFGGAAAMLLAMSLLHPPSQDANAGVSPSVTSDLFLQNAVAQADSVYRQAAVETGPQLQSFYMTGSAFARANATTARLQLQGMGSGLAYYLSIDAWRPRNAPYWLRNGLAGVEQASSEKTIAAAKAMPISSVVQSNLSAAASRF